MRFLLAASLLASIVSAADILKTDGFASCISNATIQVQRSDIQFDRATNVVTFDVAGSSSQEQKVKAILTITAYGKQVAQREFDPCEQNITVLCPVPKGNFSAKGTFDIPPAVLAQVPSNLLGLAFSIPDLDGLAKLELKSADGGQSLACLESTVTNGRTTSVAAVSYVSAGIAAVALVAGGLGALGAAGGAAGGGAVGGATGASFTLVMTWFQGIAIDGMLSVEYPPIYRSFTKNFGWSTGLISWPGLQRSIDNFRSKTGGNLTASSYDVLQNSTLIYTQPGDMMNLAKRGLDSPLAIFARAIETSINGTTSTVGGGSAASNSTNPNKSYRFVNNAQAYFETLQTPDSNVFMNVLLVFAIVVASIIVGILLFKVILEAWSLCGKFPKNLVGFRKRYWGTIARTIVNLILLLYGIWVLYCIYQFTRGDAWGAKILAGVTLALFTAVLVGFTWRIHSLAQRFKKSDGSVGPLFDDKDTWRHYSLFYASYKRDYWWIFVPVIIHAFAKGVATAAGNGHGLPQVAAILAIETVMLILLIWTRPFETKAANWLNIIIQVVNVLSTACILIFVNQLGVQRTTKTIIGVVLIAVQGILTATLAILLIVNAIIICCKDNPHRKRRKEAEKNRDNLTPLDPHNSLMDPAAMAGSTEYAGGSGYTTKAHDGKGAYYKTPTTDAFDHTRTISNEQTYPHTGTAEYGYPSAAAASHQQPYGDGGHYQYERPIHDRQPSQDQLLTSAASMGNRPESYRQASGYSGYSQDYQGYQNYQQYQPQR